MSEAKHTLGPWTVDASFGGGVVMAGSLQVASATLTGNRPKDERDANAHLIAAAPDMLAVLQRISVSYRGYIPDFVEAVNAAIDKATGVQP